MSRFLNRKNNPVACAVAEQLTNLGLHCIYRKDRELVPIAHVHKTGTCAAVRRAEWNGNRWDITAEIDLYTQIETSARQNDEKIEFTIRLKEAKHPDKVAAEIVSEFLRRKPDLLMRGM